MRHYSIVLIPLFLATTAHAQVVDPTLSQQPGWELRQGDAAIPEPMRLRPSSEPSLLAQTAATLQLASTPTNPAYVAPANPAYTGHSLLGGTLVLGTGLATYYDDNVFASSTNRRSDVAVLARPEFAWQTNGKGYAVGVDGFLEAKAFDQYTSENQLNGSVGTAFKIAPTSDSQVLGSMRYMHGHLDRGTSETVSASGVLLSTLFQSPITYDQGTASLIYNKRFDDWWMSLGTNGTLMKVQNADIGGAVQVDLNYANGQTGSVNARVGHVVAPLTSVFAEVALNKRDFGVDAFDSQGYRVVVGGLFEPEAGGRIRGEVWAGYMNQDYQGSSFQTVSTFTYAGAMAFALTNQLSMAIEGRREAKEAALSVGVLGPTQIGVNDTLCSIASAACVSAIQSTIGGRFDYRIMPNLVVGAGTNYIVDQYLGPRVAGRVDHTLSPVANIKYAATNRVTFGFDYRRLNFDPSGGEAAGIAAPSYTRNVYLLSMAGKF